jgi:hypothetical protein
MASFQMLVEALDKKTFVDKESLIGNSDPDNDTEKAIRLGLQFSSSLEEGETFWDIFIKVFQSDADAIGDLLDIPRHKIAHMPYLVKDALEQYRKTTRQDTGKNKKQRSNMINTGDGAASGQMATGRSQEVNVASAAGQFGDRDVAGMGNK